MKIIKFYIIPMDILLYKLAGHPPYFSILTKI